MKKTVRRHSEPSSWQMTLPYQEKLFSMRKKLVEKRQKYEVEFDHLKAEIDNVKRNAEAPNVDQMRYALGKKIIKYIRKTRRYAQSIAIGRDDNDDDVDDDDEDHHDSLDDDLVDDFLRSTASFLSPFRQTWEKTSYFGDASAFRQISIPPNEEICAPLNQPRGVRPERKRCGISDDVMANFEMKSINYFHACKF